jgi:hypothetical protein
VAGVVHLHGPGHPGVAQVDVAQQAAREQWRTVRRPAAVRAAAQLLLGQEWTPSLFRLLCEAIGGAGDVEPVIGKLGALPEDEYPRALALLLLNRNAWDQANACTFAKRLGVTLSAKVIDAAVTPAPAKKATGR